MHYYHKMYMRTDGRGSLFPEPRYWPTGFLAFMRPDPYLDGTQPPDSTPYEGRQRVPNPLVRIIEPINPSKEHGAGGKVVEFVSTHK
ncbi:hypothetical protein CFAM422_005260 [Trichoderma lentiforme]|uniref:Uncharacterized protein n=1 Tax=Trichoderma lentiforme TaxID=1567552 RepID=A0A9P5CCA1_9HYPO|nr:hypothetical protein CFAM422_005260 [Trichoderma lentiforme]